MRRGRCAIGGGELVAFLSQNPSSAPCRATRERESGAVRQRGLGGAPRSVGTPAGGIRLADVEDQNATRRSQRRECFKCLVPLDVFDKVVEDAAAYDGIGEMMQIQ